MGEKRVDKLRRTSLLQAESEVARLERKEKEGKHIEQVKEVFSSRTRLVTLDDGRKVSRYEAFGIGELPEELIADEHYWYIVLRTLTNDVAGIEKQKAFYTKVKRILPESIEPFLAAGREALTHAKTLYYQEFDSLTSLANKGRLKGTLERGLSTPTVIVMFDIDEFKAANDTYGHLAGDELLISIAQNLNSIVHDLFGIYARAYRFGGEEFTLLIDMEKSNISKENLYDKLHVLFSRLTKSIYTFSSVREGFHYPLSVSVGYQIFDPQVDVKKGISPMDKLGEADTLLLQAKKTKGSLERMIEEEEEEEEEKKAEEKEEKDGQAVEENKGEQTTQKKMARFYILPKPEPKATPQSGYMFD